MTGIVLAGGTPAESQPLYRYTRGKPKALIDMGGRTMLERVVDALHDARRVVQDVIVVGIDRDARETLEFTRSVHYVADHGTMIDNIVAGLRLLRKNRPEDRSALLCSADIPHLRGPVVEEFVEACRPFDLPLYYAVVTPQVMEARYPESRRSYLRFRGGVRIAGGDIFVVTDEISDAGIEASRLLTEARKHPLRLARNIGWATMFKYLAGRLSLVELEQAGGRFLGSAKPVKAVFCPHAEVAMDGDTPHQIDLLRAGLAGQE